MKTLWYVQFEHESRFSGSVVGPSQVPNIEKIILDASSFDESTLRIRDETIDERLQPQFQHFRDYFGKGVNETNWLEVLYCLRKSFFGKQGDRRPIEFMQRACVQVVDATEGSNHFIFNDRPALLVEGTSETVRAGRLFRWHL